MERINGELFQSALLLKGTWRSGNYWFVAAGCNPVDSVIARFDSEGRHFTTEATFLEPGQDRKIAALRFSVGFGGNLGLWLNWESTPFASERLRVQVASGPL